MGFDDFRRDPREIPEPLRVVPAQPFFTDAGLEYCCYISKVELSYEHFSLHAVRHAHNAIVEGVSRRQCS